MSSGAGYRCVGTLHGPVGDCGRRVTGALFCYGYLDRDQGVPMQDSLEGPLPLVFPACDEHRAALTQWAEMLWGQIAEGIWVEAAAIPALLREIRAEGETVVLAPDPSQAVRIAAA